MFTDTIKSSINTTYDNPPTTSKLNFCGYSVLKNGLSARNTKTDNIIGSIIQNTSLNEQESLLQMYFSKVKVINDTDKSQLHIKDFYELSTEYDLGLCIDEKKLQSAWKSINYITDISSSPSWSTTILLGTITAVISGLFKNTKTPYTDMLSNIICYSGFAVLTKITYNFMRDITGSKPRLLQLTNIKKQWEKCLSDDAIEKNIKDPSINQEDSQINKSFFDMSNFPVLFDNLYRFLGVSSEQTLALFNATLIGIVDTWIEINSEQLSTDENATKIDSGTVNKKIIENTLLALELNRLSFQKKQTIKLEEENILIASIRARNNMYLQNIELAYANQTIRFTEKKNILQKNINDLKQGFYTMSVYTFLALRVTENFEGKVYCLFIPLLNMSYQSSSVYNICNLISNFAEYRNIKLDKIGGEIEQPTIKTKHRVQIKHYF